MIVYRCTIEYITFYKLLVNGCYHYQTVKSVPCGVRDSGVLIRSSVDMGEGLGEVIDQCPETLLVPSTCRRTEQMEF